MRVSEIPKNTFPRYLHEKSGNYYRLICVTNEEATRADQADEWTRKAVYYDEAEERIWDRPFSEFQRKFRLVEVGG